jgi:hypothetical protein
MLRALVLALIIGALSALSSSTSAQPLVCPPIDFGADFGAPPSNFVILTDQLDECGVTFSTVDPEGVYWIGGGGYSSFTYCILAGALYQGGDPAGVDPIRIDFESPVQSVSIRGYDGGGDADTMILDAFAAGNVLIDTETITADFEFPGLVATVSGQIEYVTVRVEGTVSGLFFDDLDWDVAVSSPESVASASWGRIKSSYR